MEVGEAVTYVDPSGVIQDALIAKLFDGSANLVLISKSGAEDHFGKNRAELLGVPIGNHPGCCCKLDGYEAPESQKKTPKKKEK